MPPLRPALILFLMLVPACTARPVSVSEPASEPVEAAEKAQTADLSEVAHGPAAPDATPTPDVRPSRRTVADVLRIFGPDAEARLKPYFQRAGTPYPPRRVYLLAFKQEKKLELWTRTGQLPVLIRSYPILAASGTSGPKLKQGDLQVPEGIYGIEWLQPNSSYHLSLKVDYPNAFDQDKARLSNRTGLGGDIFVHGRDVSIGCIAVGDSAIEELFVLAAKVGHSNVTLIIAPHDFRRRPPQPRTAGNVPWLSELYQSISDALRAFPVN